MAKKRRGALQSKFTVRSRYTCARARISAMPNWTFSADSHEEDSQRGLAEHVPAVSHYV